MYFVHEIAVFRALPQNLIKNFYWIIIHTAKNHGTSFAPPPLALTQLINKLHKLRQIS